MSTITSASFAKALWPGVNEWYGNAYSEYPVEYTDLFDTFQSDKQWEEDVGYSGMGQFRVKPEGSAIEYDSFKQGFTTRYTHVVYALGFVITREVYEDDQYDVVGKKKAQQLAFSNRQTKETVAANVYNRAFNSSYTFGDGKEMINSTLPNVAGGTWSNRPTNYVDISEAALEQAAIDIAGFTDDRGNKIALMPKTLLVPKELMFEVTRILKSDMQVNSAEHNVNALKLMGIIPEVKINHYFTDTDAWFIRTNLPTAGLRHFERWADRFEMDNDWDTDNAKFKAVGRYSFGISDKRAIYGSQGA